MTEPVPYFAAGGFAFRPVGDGDVERLVGWLNDPAVGAWWHGVSETYDEAFVREDMFDEPGSTRAIVELDGEPIGFQQWYPLDGDLETLAALGIKDGTGAFGIDQIIGESRLHDRGIGSRQVRAVADWLLGPDGPGAMRVITDPVVENLRAVRCYEKAGFQKVRVIARHEEIDHVLRDAWLMEFDPRSPGP